jgi:hypothetical protein
MASIRIGKFPTPTIRFDVSDRQINPPALLQAVETPVRHEAGKCRPGYGPTEPQAAGWLIRWRRAWPHRAPESHPCAWLPMRWQQKIQVSLTGRTV